MPYPLDPALRVRSIALLGSVWTALPAAVERARGWGADWLEWSEPFVEREAGEVVAHVGVMELHAVLDGRDRTLAGIHAVCTRADRRGRGHLRATMDRALSWVDARYETAVLWANDPAVYGRFGFTPRRESVFHGPLAPRPSSSSSSSGSTRGLSLDVVDDVRLLRARLDGRAPVSTDCGVRGSGWLALIDLALWRPPGPRLVLVPALDCIVVHEVRGRTLRLYDVIAPQMPTLAALTGELAHELAGVDAVEAFFSPQGLNAPSLKAARTSLDDVLMVRGRDVGSDAPLAFSPLTRC